MSYLIGTFQRHHSEIFESEEPLSDVAIVDELKKEHLVLARGDDDYQVINLITREYFNPIKNEWVKIKRK